MTNLETDLVEVLTCEVIHFCSRTVQLAQMRMASMRDFIQWLCKESACRAAWVNYDKAASSTGNSRIWVWRGWGER